MDTLTLCGWSAFQWHRIPPLVRMLYLSGIEEGSSALLDDPSLPLLGGIDRPLHVLAADDAHKSRKAGTVPHLTKLALPREARTPLYEGLFATDLNYTLLTLAESLSSIRLALALSEVMGSFCIYQPPFELQLALDQIAEGNLAEFGDLAADLRLESLHGWQQACDLKDRPTNLWKRPPLSTREHLLSFVSSLPKGTRNLDKFRDALSLALENAASPLEVEAALLLGLPRRRGGEGLGPVICNKRIPLSAEAQDIAGQRVCYADLFFATPGTRGRVHMLDIECQSISWHDAAEKGIADGIRSTALQCMGLDVMFITKKQLEDDGQAAEIAREARNRLGIQLPDPSSALLSKRDALRREVIVDWLGIGKP